MKKTVLIAGLGIMVFASCQKENATNDAKDTITRTITVEAPETRSLYEAGQGVHLTNTEFMTVNYWTDSETATGMKSTGSAATGNGDGTWSFSHDAVAGATSYGYQFIMPYTSKNALNSQGTSALLRLYPVQFPGANTFDPSVDYLSGQAIIGAAAPGTSASVTFKRLFVPLQIQIQDPDGVLDGETVYAVSLHINSEPAVNNSLAGNAYVNANADYAEAGINSFNNNTNTVTAIYSTGLAKTSGTYNAWYIVYPVSLKEATGIEINVYTDKGRHTKTGTLPEFALVNDNIGRLSVSLSGEGYSKGNDLFIVTSVYTNKNRITERWTGVSWVGQSNLQKDTAPSILNTGLRITAGGGVKYVNDGLSIKKVRLYLSPLAANNDVSTMHFVDADGNELCSDVSVKYNDIAVTDGYAEVEFNKAVNSFTMTNSSTDKYAYISAFQVIPE